MHNTKSVSGPGEGVNNFSLGKGQMSNDKGSPIMSRFVISPLTLQPTSTNVDILPTFRRR